MALTKATVDTAIEAIVNGAQSYTVDGITYTKASLDQLWKLRKELAAEEAQSDYSILDYPRYGRPRRSTS